MVPPLGQYLIAGDGDWLEGVLIPELETRMHELPPPDKVIQVVGERAEERVAWLGERGRQATVCDTARIGSSAPSLPAFRLWTPNPLLEEWLTEQRPLPGKAVDIGCGSGRDSVFLAATGWDVTAIDHLEDAIHKGRDLESRYAPVGNVRWICGDGESAPNDVFDLVLLLRCYSPGLLQAAWNRLSPGGWILLESFTAAFRANTGKPRNPDWVFDPSHLPPEATVVSRSNNDRWQQVVLGRT